MLTQPNRTYWLWRCRYAVFVLGVWSQPLYGHILHNHLASTTCTDTGLGVDSETVHVVLHAPTSGSGSGTFINRYNGGGFNTTPVSWSGGTCSPAFINLGLSPPTGTTITLDVGMMGAGLLLTYSATDGGTVCDGATGQAFITGSDLNADGTPYNSCTTPTTIHVTLQGANLAAASKVHVDALIGSGGSGYLTHFFLGNGVTSQTLSIPASIGGTLDGGPINAAILDGSYAYNNAGAPGKLGISFPTTPMHCGETINIVVTADFAGTPDETPTPNPTPTPDQPTPTAAPSSTPIPNPTPVITPGPFGSPPPASGTTPPPNVSVNSPGGGTATNTVINNPNDFYGPVKKAMEDAARGMGAPGDGDGGGGSFGTGNGDHEAGDYDDRGHVDDLQGEMNNAATARTGIVDGVSGMISTLTAQATALGGQTFGSVSTITMDFNSIGIAPAVGKVTLPTVIDLTQWSGMISTLRLILLWLVRIGFFVLVFRLCAAQRVTAAA